MILILCFSLKLVTEPVAETCFSNYCF